MPSGADVRWPGGLLSIFEHARSKPAPFETSYYGPYDKLLNYCFGSDFNFYAAPQNPPRDDSWKAVDLGVSASPDRRLTAYFIKPSEDAFRLPIGGTCDEHISH